MIRAKLTSKGQITIPVAVRHKLNLQPGDELLFEFDRNNEVKLRTLKRKQLTELYASLPAKKPFPNKEQVREEVANGIFPDNPDLLLQALKDMADNNVDFADAYLAATARTRSEAVCSFDNGFTKLNVSLVIPPETGK